MRARSLTRSLVLGMLVVVAIAVAATMTLPFAGSPQRAGATDGASLALDMDIDNGNGPCDPIDNVRKVDLSAPDYKVAVCLKDSAVPPAAFNFNLLYDDTLNQCPETDCTSGICVDDNPDANDGATVFTTPDLGGEWDCGNFDTQPVCDINPQEAGPGKGMIYMSCISVEPPTLPVGAGVSAPIAVVTFKTIAAGTDTLTLDNAALYDENSAKMLGCYYGAGPCVGGAITESGEPPPTAPAPATKPGETPSAGAGTAAVDATPAATMVPSEGSGASTDEDGSSGPNAAVIAGVVVGGVIVLAAGGWFVWRRLRTG